MRSDGVTQKDDTISQEPTSVLPDLGSEVCYSILEAFRTYCGTTWQELDEKVSTVMEEKGEHNLGTGMRNPGLR